MNTESKIWSAITFDTFYGCSTMALLLYISPLIIVSNNGDEFLHYDLIFTLACLLATTIAAVAVFLATVHLLGPTRVSRGRAIIRISFFFVGSTALLFPLTKPAGQMEIDRIPLATMNLLGAVALALVLYIISISKAHKSVMFGSAAVLATTLVSESYAVYSLLAPKDFNSIYTASSNRNLFVLSFDGLPRDLSVEVLRENPELTTAFKDFTVFSNAVSSSPATFASIATELSGIADVKTKFVTSRAMADAIAYGPNMIPNRLVGNGYAAAAYGMYHIGLADKSRRFANGTLSRHYTTRQRLDQVAELYQYSIARTLSSALVYSGGFTNRLSGLLGVSEEPDERERENVENQRKLYERTLHHVGPKWDVSAVLTILDFQTYLKNLTVKTDKPVAHFTHFLFTHFPVDFTKDCEYQGDNPGWFESHQNNEGLKNQTYCALHQFKRFTDKLKALGIYDRSLIILKSDHGEPPDYFSPDNYDSFRIRSHTHWGFARYTPFLAFKGLGTHSSELHLDERPVALGDLARSICMSLIRPKSSCDTYEGYDIFDPRMRIPDDAQYSLQIVQDSQSTFHLEDHVAITLPRTTNFFESLNDRLTSELLSEPPSCDHVVDATKGAIYNNGRTDNRSWVYWHNNGRTFIKFRRPACPVVAIEVELKRTSPASVTVAESAMVAMTDGDSLSPPRSHPARGDSGLIDRIELNGPIGAGDFLVAEIKAKGGPMGDQIDNFRLVTKADNDEDNRTGVRRP